MTIFMSKIRVAVALGLGNILSVIFYRVCLKFRFFSLLNSRVNIPQAPFFLPQDLPKIDAQPVLNWQKSALLFGSLPYKVSNSPPNWFANTIKDQSKSYSDKPWWLIPDFDPDVGDIKLIWEISRMDWVLAFAERARNGDSNTLDQLNIWLADWVRHNPPYYGSNWKCGQEASIRVMNLCIASIVMGQVECPPSGLVDLIKIHLKRISMTLPYAIAQDNNHGTSEAAALFMGGSWLEVLGDTDGRKWASRGRYWLENRATKLIGLHGSFSQYSLNYHRVMIDTYCMAEVWRKHLMLPDFSSNLRTRIQLATRWLQHIINPINGDGPNVGANDGARFLQLTDSNFRDYRPTVQLAMALFFKLDYMGGCYKSACYELESIENSKAPKYWNTLLLWLSIKSPLQLAPQAKSLVADDGGFAILRRGSVMTMLRYPRFQFRPSQADLLHLDLWLAGSNVLRDAGTYSYNTEANWLKYFAGTASHNTIEFDARDQMPRLGRFLFGDWLKTSFIEPLIEDAQKISFSAGYVDRQGVAHRRSIKLSDSNLIVSDEISGFKSKAILRWRLKPGNWYLSCNGKKYICEFGDDFDGNTLRKISISANIPILRCEIVKGWESRFYGEKTQVPVLEVEVIRYGKIITECYW